MAAPATIHLVRHAAHGLLPHTLAGRLPGVGLSAEGEAQAVQLARRFAGQDVGGVFTSPVQRAVETARPIGTRVGQVPTPEAGFEEIDFGAWTGQRFDALASDPAWDRWNRLRSLACCPGGESMHQAQSRALATLERLQRAYKGRTIVVVSHADIIKALLAPALGLALDQLHRLRIDPASVSTLLVFDADWRVDCVNG